MVYHNIQQKYVTTDKNGQTLLYIKVLNALYGIFNSALLFNKNLVKNLEDYGLHTNTYGPCLANETVNGKHMTVTWHMDGL